MSDEIKYLGEEGLDTLIDKVSGIQKTMTLEQYNALSDAEKNNGTYYHVKMSDGQILPVKTLTQAEYDALGNSKLTDNTIYIITDADYDLDADNIKYGSGSVSDKFTSLDTVISGKASKNESLLKGNFASNLFRDVSFKTINTYVETSYFFSFANTCTDNPSSKVTWGFGIGVKQGWFSNSTFYLVWNHEAMDSFIVYD